MSYARLRTAMAPRWNRGLTPKKKKHIRGAVAKHSFHFLVGIAMASLCVVKDSAGEYFCIFEQACEAYLNRLWPDWKTNDRTYMFPPTFPFRYTAPTGAASGAVGLSKSEHRRPKREIRRNN